MADPPNSPLDAPPGDDEVAHYTGPNNARWVVVGFVALIVGFVIYMALGMPGMDHGGGGGMDHDNMDMDDGMLPAIVWTS